MPRKRGKIIMEMATISGRHHPGAIHRWLHGLEREGLEGRHDRRGPGRSRRLAPEQSIKDDLDGPPSESGFGRGSWNAGMIAGRIGDRFGVIPCSRRAALRIADRLGFSTCEPWSVPYDGATPEGQAAFIEKMVHIRPHTLQTSRGSYHGRDGHHNETEKRLAQR